MILHIKKFTFQNLIEDDRVAVRPHTQVGRVKAMAVEVGVLDENGVIIVDGIVFIDFVKCIFVPVDQMTDWTQKFGNDVPVSRREYGCFGFLFEKMLLGCVIELEVQIAICPDVQLIKFCVYVYFNVIPAAMNFINIKTLINRVDQFFAYPFLEPVLTGLDFLLHRIRQFIEIINIIRRSHFKGELGGIHWKDILRAGKPV